MRMKITRSADWWAACIFHPAKLIPWFPPRNFQIPDFPSHALICAVQANQSTRHAEFRLLFN